MGKLTEENEVQKELIELTLQELGTALKGKKSNAAVLGMATYVHNFYSGIENILKRILNVNRIKFNTNSASWHKDLINTAMSKKIISETLYLKLDEYLVFRHFFVHAYGVRIRFDRFRDLAKDAQNVWNEFYSQVEPIILKLDKDN